MDKEILNRPINRTREYTDREEQLTDQRHLNEIATFEQLQSIFRQLQILEELDLKNPFPNPNEKS